MCAHAVSQRVPHFASTLFGREAEIALLDQLISDPSCPVVTITGSSGIGKTRLAAHVARFVDAPDTLFVPLATIVDPDLVVPELGQALGLQDGSWQDSILEKLQDWNGIVVLDNFEQVIDAAADLAAILPRNPNLTVIITSQRPLLIEGERIIRLEPLEVPADSQDLTEVRGTPSVQLLLERAASQDTSILEAMTNESTAMAVGDICRRLDGLPLALELAASRMATLTPEVVLQQLDQGQSILSGSRRDIPQRHRTMQSAITWSVDLLPASTRRIFLWLGAFTGGFDLEIVAQLSDHMDTNDDPIDTISELFHLNLIRRVHGGSQPWYSMLEPIRGYCLATLDESGDREAAEEFVAAYVLDLATRSREELSGPNVGEWLNRLARERATIRGAVHWGLDHEEPHVPMAVGARMFPYFEQEGTWREVVNWIDVAMKWQDKLPPEDVINALISKIAIHEQAHDLEAVAHTDAMVHELLQQHDLPILEMRYLVVTCNVAIDKKEWDTAETRFQRVLELGKQEDYAPATSTALANLGNIAHHRGDPEAAKAFLLEALDIFRDMGNMHNVAQAYSNLGSVHVSQGEYSDALGYFAQASSLTADLGLRYPRIYNLLGIAAVNHGLLDLDAADAAAEEAISEAQAMEYQQLEVIGNIRLATSALIREDAGEIYTRVRTALALQQQAGGSKEYVELGILIASALELEGDEAEATPILGRSLSWGREIDYSPDLHAQKSLDALQTRLRGSVSDYDQLIATGESWSEQTFIQVLTRVAGESRSRSGTLLVSIPEPASSPLEQLTRRENEILQLLVNGNSTQEMSDVLSVSPRTVTTHLGNIMGKLGVSSRAELVALALRNPS